MKDIRIGNDLNVIWSINAVDGTPFPLEGKDVSVYLCSPSNRIEVKDFSLDTNKVRYTFFGKDQKQTGKYSLELVINDGERGMVTTDVCHFVNLVSCSCKVGGDDESNIITETVDITTEVDFVAIIIDKELSETSENAVSNKAVTIELNKKADKSSIPTKVSQLTNDSGYLTSHQDISHLATKKEVEEISEEIGHKQDIITDLDAIRRGAQKGATALQSIPAEYVTDDELENALRNKVNKNEVATINGKSIINGGNITIEGGGGATAPMVSVTYAELKALRDNGELIAGMQYRITDYVTTTTQSNTQSAGHQFDIIVVADDVNVLNEKARVIQHEGDTYFANSDLNVWEVKYCLDNDTERFAWADSANGKGVIYRMIDEFGNDCFYDFKNIQLYRDNIAAMPADYYYTFHLTTTYSDRSLSHLCAGNKIGKLVLDGVCHIPTNVFMSAPAACKNNILGEGCTGNIFHGISEGNVFGFGCVRNTFGSQLQYNVFGTGCSDNTFGNSAKNNVFGDLCSNNTFGNNFQRNTLEAECSNNTFGNSSSDNHLAFRCQNNTFGISAKRNSLGTECSNNQFGRYAQGNTMGKSCQHNVFGDWFKNNTLWKSCTYNKCEIAYSAFNTFSNGVSFVELENTYTASSNNQVQNYVITEGVKGSDSEQLVLIVDRNNGYQTHISKSSSGEIKEFCTADLIQ